MLKVSSVPKTKCPFRKILFWHRECIKEKCAIHYTHESGEEACAFRWLPIMQIEQNGVMIAQQRLSEQMRNKIAPDANG